MALSKYPADWDEAPKQRQRSSDIVEVEFADEMFVAVGGVLKVWGKADFGRFCGRLAGSGSACRGRSVLVRIVNRC